MAKFNWKVLGVVATIAGGLVSIAAGIIDDKKRSEEIRNEVKNELARQTADEES